MRMKQLRLEKGLTQTELADKIGVKQKDISRWENGTYKPKLDKLQLITKALECDLIELIE